MIVFTVPTTGPGYSVVYGRLLKPAVSICVRFNLQVNRSQANQCHNSRYLNCTKPHQSSSAARFWAKVWFLIGMSCCRKLLSLFVGPLQLIKLCQPWVCQGSWCFIFHFYRKPHSLTHIHRAVHTLITPRWVVFFLLLASASTRCCQSWMLVCLLNKK